MLKTRHAAIAFVFAVVSLFMMGVQIAEASGRWVWNGYGWVYEYTYVPTHPAPLWSGPYWWLHPQYRPHTHRHYGHHGYSGGHQGSHKDHK